MPAHQLTVPSRRTATRREPIEVPSDPVEATAAVLAFVNRDGDSGERSAAIEAMTARVTRLMSDDRQVLSEELAGHAAILTALFHRFTAESIAAPNSDAKAKFAKLALHSQTAALRTMSALATVRGRVVDPLPPDNVDD